MTDGTRLLRYILPGGTTLFAVFTYALTIDRSQEFIKRAVATPPEDLSNVLGLAGLLVGAAILTGYLALNIYHFVMSSTRQFTAAPWPILFRWIDDTRLLTENRPDLQREQGPFVDAGALDALVQIRGSSAVSATTLERARGLLDLINGLGATAAGLFSTAVVSIITYKVADPEPCLFTAWISGVTLMAVVFTIAQRRTCITTTAYLDVMLRLTARRRA